MRHEQLKRRDSFDVVEISANEGPAAPALAEIELGCTRLPERAVPDVPASVGMMIAAAYVAIIGLFAVTIANVGSGPFIIAIDLAFLAAFLAVPVIFLKVEGDPSRRPSLGRFLTQGMHTYTGHVSGKAALTQMLVVPVLLAFAVLAIGIVAMNA
jgi:hypothetical protein